MKKLLSIMLALFIVGGIVTGCAPEAAPAEGEGAAAPADAGTTPAPEGE